MAIGWQDMDGVSSCEGHMDVVQVNRRRGKCIVPAAAGGSEESGHPLDGAHDLDLGLRVDAHGAGNDSRNVT